MSAKNPICSNKRQIHKIYIKTFVAYLCANFQQLKYKLINIFLTLISLYLLRSAHLVIYEKYVIYLSLKKKIVE